ncbi:MAG TPA: hypothetical protein VN132_07590 [Bdellovibrio sp.]|nr:hypothetical protein [Bdellovibrio sp.]
MPLKLPAFSKEMSQTEFETFKSALVQKMIKPPMDCCLAAGFLFSTAVGVSEKAIKVARVSITVSTIALGATVETITWLKKRGQAKAAELLARQADDQINSGLDGLKREEAMYESLLKTATNPAIIQELQKNIAATRASEENLRSVQAKLKSAS